MFNENPSKEYLENINFYKKMHRDGHYIVDGRKREAVETYDGKSTTTYALIIKEIINKNKISTMLDYGCGKGSFYNKEFILNNKKINSLKDLWSIDIDLFDPCYEEHSSINEDKYYDMTICIDVLEHIPSQDIDWVLYKIFNKTKKYVFMNVACYPAIALLPNGKNAHININNPQWWHKKILQIKKKFLNLKIICICSIKKNKGMSYFPLQYDDKLSNYSF